MARTKKAAAKTAEVVTTPEAVTPEVTTPEATEAVTPEAAAEASAPETPKAAEGAKKESHKAWISISEKQVKETKTADRFLVNLGMVNDKGETSYGYVFVGPKSFAEKDGRKLLILPKDKPVKVFEGFGEDRSYKEMTGAEVQTMNRAYVDKIRAERVAQKDAPDAAAVQPTVTEPTQPEAADELEM